MKAFVIISLSALLLYSVSGNAQQRYVPLQIGDRVPDVKLSFHDGKRAVFSEYEGKAVILDFWATWCAPCIASMPTVHALQRKFEGQVQILLVNGTDSKSEVSKFIQKRETKPTARITLPVIAGDSILSKVLFKGEEVPRYYWIDKTGKLAFYTSKHEVTEGNIRLFLDQSRVNYFSNPPAFQPLSTLTPSRLRWKSELEISDGKGDSHLIYENEGVSGITCARMSVLDLYQFAFGTFHDHSPRSHSWVERWPFNRTILESSKARNPGRHSQNTNQADTIYSYRLSAPDFSTWEQMSNVMLGDLNNWFGYTAVMEPRNVKCLALSIPDSTVFKNVSGPRHYKITDVEFQIHAMTVADVLRNLRDNILGGRHFLYRYPVVYESAYRGLIGNINIENVDTSDPAALEKALAVYGIRLQLVERRLPTLVVRDLKL